MISLSKGVDEMKRERTSITLPENVMAKIKEYQEKHFLPSFSATIAILAMKEIEREEKGKWN